MSETKPFFSIIIPTYNRADLIGKTLTSVLQQTFSDFEVLVIDDGSTDATRQVVEAFNDKRLSYIFQANAERGAARNNGIDHANGKYITFLDSDDIFLPDHLQIVHSNIKGFNEPAFYHQPYQIKSTGGKSKHINYSNLKRPIKKLIRQGNFLSCSGVFLNTNKISNIRFDPDRTLSGSEDYELWLRLAVQYDLFIGKEETSILINHEDRGENNINLEQLKKRVEYLINKTISNEAFWMKYGKWQNSFLSSNYSFIALHMAIANEKKAAIKYVIKAISKNPCILFSKRMSVIIYKLII